jgi:hypothetical protein
MYSLELTDEIKTILNHLKRQEIKIAQQLFDWYQENSPLFTCPQEAILLAQLIQDKYPVETITTLFADYIIAKIAKSNRIATTDISYQVAESPSLDEEYMYYSDDISSLIANSSDSNSIDISLYHKQKKLSLTLLGSTLCNDYFQKQPVNEKYLKEILFYLISEDIFPYIFYNYAEKGDRQTDKMVFRSSQIWRSLPQSIQDIVEMHWAIQDSKKQFCRNKNFRWWMQPITDRLAMEGPLDLKKLSQKTVQTINHDLETYLGLNTSLLYQYIDRFIQRIVAAQITDNREQEFLLRLFNILRSHISNSGLEQTIQNNLLTVFDKHLFPFMTMELQTIDKIANPPLKEFIKETQSKTFKARLAIQGNTQDKSTQTEEMSTLFFSKCKQ